MVAGTYQKGGGGGLRPRSLWTNIGPIRFFANLVFSNDGHLGLEGGGVPGGGDTPPPPPATRGSADARSSTDACLS